jgi:hypothetical protein
MDGVDSVSSGGALPPPPPVDNSSDSAPVGGTGASDGGTDTSTASTSASTPSAPPPIQDSFDAGPANSATGTGATTPASPAAPTTGTGTDTSNKSAVNTFQADRNKDTFTAAPAKGQPVALNDPPKPATQPAPTTDTKKADEPKADVRADVKADEQKADAPKPTQQPTPATDAKKADDKKADQSKPAPQPSPTDAKKTDAPKPDVKADEKKTDDKKPAEQPKPANQPSPTDTKKTDDKKPADTKADEKKADAQKADEKKADEKKPETKADDKKTDDKKPDTKKADEKKADDKKPDDKKADPKADDKKTGDKKDEKKADEKKSKPTEVTVSKDEIKAKKEGDLYKKETKKEVEKKGGADLPKARENKGPVAELAKGKTEEAKIGSDVGPGASAKGEFKVTLGTGGLDVNGTVKLDAHLLHATGKVETTIPFEYGGEKFQAKLALSGDLKIGGDANLKVNLHVGTDGRLSVNLGADGFAGVKGELKGTVSVESKPGNDPNAEFKPLVEGNATLSAYAGVAAGAKFNVQGDLASGKIGFEAKAFASAGVGVGFGLDGTINTKNVADLAGRVGMKFANDVGNAVNLPGATMDYFNASSRASELDKIGAPITAKAHAGDAWVKQGYDKLLPSEQLNKALGTLSYHENYDMVDTAAGIGSKDGVIGKVDLEAAMRNESFPPDVRAAAYHLLQSGAWDRLQQDGLVHKNGQNPWNQMYTPENKAYFKQQDQVETARRDMANQSQNLQRKAGGMWMDFQGAQNPNQLKDLLGRIDGELGNTQQWGGVKAVRGAPYDAVAHEANLRALRQQVADRLAGK